MNEKPEKEEKEGSESPIGAHLEEIAKSGGVTARSDGETIHCLSIIGQIEGHYVLDQTQKTTKYEHLIPLLCAVEESREIDGLLLILNTMGGDVEAGLAIAEMVASMKKPAVTLVLGGGHSIGVPQTFYYFDKMQDRIVHFICAHSQVAEGKLREMMNNTSELANDVGTIIDGREAVGCGLIDAVGGLSDALDALKGFIAADARRTERH